MFRDSTGTWLHGYTKYLHHKDALHEEIVALFHNLRIVITHNYQHLIVETVSHVLISLLPLGNRKYLTILHGCRSMLLELQVSKLHHTFREGNGMADALAKYGKQLHLHHHPDALLFETPPPHPLYFLIVRF